MAFHVGDKVGWNSEAGHVQGTIKKVHKKPFKVNGYTKHASENKPVYQILSNKSNHVAYHFGKALHYALILLKGVAMLTVVIIILFFMLLDIILGGNVQMVIANWRLV